MDQGHIIFRVLHHENISITMDAGVSLFFGLHGQYTISTAQESYTVGASEVYAVSPFTLYRAVSGENAGVLQITLSPIHSFGTSAYPLLILRTLEEAIAPMDQRELIAQIQRTHGVTPERKAVGRNVALLKALGYDIRRERGGYVLLRESGSLTEGELRLLTDSVLANAALTADEREALIEKLLTL